MRTLGGIFLAITCLGLLAMAFAWPHTFRQGDAFILSDHEGHAFGMATNPGEVFFSNNRDQKNNPATLVSSPGSKHYRYPPRDPGRLDRYTIVTHTALRGIREFSGARRPVGFGQPQFATRWALPGIRAQGGTFNGIDYEQIVISFWLITCALAIGPAITAVRLVARITRRRRHGQCPACGYDLRASTDRCPECNHPIPTPSNPPPTPPPVKHDHEDCQLRRGEQSV